MSSSGNRLKILDELKVSTRMKVSALWISLMFLFIYVDHFALFMPGVLEDIAGGKMRSFKVSQGSLLAGMALMVIPSLMIFLTVALKSAASRWTNIVVVIVYLAVVIANVVGETWAFYIGASAVEIALLLVVAWYAWRWPKNEG